MLTMRALLLAGIAAAAPLSAGQLADPHELRESQFIPPAGPMVLTRTVWRELGDGAAIKVARTYRITITSDGDGYLVDGQPIATTVDAPKQVAALAEIERQRVETGLFPFRLDRNGQILAASRSKQPRPDHSDLARSGAQLVSRSSLPGAVQVQARTMLDQVIGAARGGVAWPADLFNPAGGDRQQRQTVPLPDGGNGEVEISIAVDRAAPGQLPRAVERTVTTLLEGTQSVTREQWTMGPQ